MQPAEPPQVQYPDCNIKSLMCFNSNVFVAMVTDPREPGKSSLFCANSQQTVEVPGKIEDCVVCAAWILRLRFSLCLSTLKNGAMTCMQ